MDKNEAGAGSLTDGVLADTRGGWKRLRGQLAGENLYGACHIKQDLV